MRIGFVFILVIIALVVSGCDVGSYEKCYMEQNILKSDKVTVNVLLCDTFSKNTEWSGSHKLLDSKQFFVIHNFDGSTSTPLFETYSDIPENSRVTIMDNKYVYTNDQIFEFENGELRKIGGIEINPPLTPFAYREKSMYYFAGKDIRKYDFIRLKDESVFDLENLSYYGIGRSADETNIICTNEEFKIILKENTLLNKSDNNLNDLKYNFCWIHEIDLLNSKYNITKEMCSFDIIATKNISNEPCGIRVIKIDKETTYILDDFK